jgi:PAS domain S-box-containing protein
MSPKASRSGRDLHLAPAVARRLALFASRAEQAIFVGGADGRLEWANEAACRLCGLSLDELVGRRLQLFPDDPDAQRQAAEHIRERFAAGARARLEASIRDREGCALWIDLEVAPVPGEAEAPDGWVAIATDVSERKRAEADLAESEESYRRMVDLSPRAVAVHCGGAVVYANRAALELVGASADGELLGRSVFDLLHPDYHRVVAERILKMEAAGDPAAPLAERILRLDGSSVEVEVAATPIVWRGQPAIQIVADPVADRGRSGADAPPRPPCVELSALVLDLAPHLEDRIAPRAQLSFELCGGLPPVEGDAVELKELVVTLVSHAAAMLPGGRGRILVRTGLGEEAGSDDAGSWVTLQIQHDGRALDPRARAALFEARFERRFPRRGPGLGKARAIARRHRGWLCLEGAPGAAERVLLRLPARSS